VPQQPEASQTDNTDPECYRAWQINHKDQPFPPVSPYPNEDALVADVKKAVAQGTEKTGKAPRVLIIGALGRCGGGAVELCLRAGVPTENVLKWDLEETGNEP
jgi:saccharopine dehydrogenase (NAD+, L-lysine-forming)